MDIICFSHLRWNFVYQRPQHLLSRMARDFRIFFIEEPIFDSDKPQLDNRPEGDNLWVIVPHLPAGSSAEECNTHQENLLRNFFNYMGVSKFVSWYYTPMALNFTGWLEPELVVFDCMDELSAFKNAPRELKDQEQALLDKADIVFTGGLSLYEAKKDRHPDVHLFPSSIDRKHFEKARTAEIELTDQSSIPHPRIGFCGVIDERMDIDLLDSIAKAKPDWQFIMIGPVVKIDPATLPKHSNIHYLGPKSYTDLPFYFSGWDVAIMPFALNESTKFISPTKTPEYLAAGLPVVSTAIHDVVRSYGDQQLAAIADETNFVDAIKTELDKEDRVDWLASVDQELAQNSWDITVEKMRRLIEEKLETSTHESLTQKEDEYV